MKTQDSAANISSEVISSEVGSRDFEEIFGRKKAQRNAKRIVSERNVSGEISGDIVSEEIVSEEVIFEEIVSKKVVSGKVISEVGRDLRASRYRKRVFLDDMYETRLRGRARRPSRAVAYSNVCDEPRKTRLARDGSPYLGALTVSGPSRTRLARRSRPTLGGRQRFRGFTLLEMIGVLAIMSILAAVIIPNVLKSIDAAAVKAEIQTTQNLAEALKSYWRTNGTIPTTAIPPATINWGTQLAGAAGLSPHEVVTTQWGSMRTYVVDPASGSSPRIMIISSMRTGLAVPTQISLNNAARFADVWDTSDGVIPSGASATLWTSWSTVTAPFLIVQRVKLDTVVTDYVTSEASIMSSLGDAVKQYLRVNGQLPTTTIPPASINWTTQLANFTQFSPNDVLLTKRGLKRVYVIEPYTWPAKPMRAMLLSSMSPGRDVPTAASINSNGNYFNDIWQTQNGVIPNGSSAILWTAWSASTAPFLTIQRINLSDIYTTDLQALTIALNNRTSTTIGYRFTEYTTGIVTSGTVSPTATTPAVPTAHPKDKLELYRDSARAQLDYTYIFSSGVSNARTFDFEDTTPPSTARWYAK